MPMLASGRKADGAAAAHCATVMKEKGLGRQAPVLPGAAAISHGPQYGEPVLCSQGALSI